MSSEGAVQNKPNGVGSTSVLRQGVGEEQRTRGNPNGPPSDTTNDFHVAEHYAKENYAKKHAKSKALEAKPSRPVESSSSNDRSGYFGYWLYFGNYIFHLFFVYSREI